MTVAIPVILRIGVVSLTVCGTRVMLVKLLGAFRPFELVTFTRNSAQPNGHDQKGK